MKSEMIQDYESPEVQVIEVEVEEGYAQSAVFTGENGRWGRSYSFDDYDYYE